MAEEVLAALSTEEGCAFVNQYIRSDRAVVVRFFDLLEHVKEDDSRCQQCLVMINRCFEVHQGEFTQDETQDICQRILNLKEFCGKTAILESLVKVFTFLLKFTPVEACIRIMNVYMEDPGVYIPFSLSFGVAISKHLWASDLQDEAIMPFVSEIFNLLAFSINQFQGTHLILSLSLLNKLRNLMPAVKEGEEDPLCRIIMQCRSFSAQWATQADIWRKIDVNWYTAQFADLAVQILGTDHSYDMVESILFFLSNALYAAAPEHYFLILDKMVWYQRESFSANMDLECWAFSIIDTIYWLRKDSLDMLVTLGGSLVQNEDIVCKLIGYFWFATLMSCDPDNVLRMVGDPLWSLADTLMGIDSFPRKLEVESFKCGLYLVSQLAKCLGVVYNDRFAAYLERAVTQLTRLSTVTTDHEVFHALGGAIERILLGFSDSRSDGFALLMERACIAENQSCCGIYMQLLSLAASGLWPLVRDHQMQLIQFVSRAISHPCDEIRTFASMLCLDKPISTYPDPTVRRSVPDAFMFLAGRILENKCNDKFERETSLVHLVQFIAGNWRLIRSQRVDILQSLLPCLRCLVENMNIFLENGAYTHPSLMVIFYAIISLPITDQERTVPLRMFAEILQSIPDREDGEWCPVLGAILDITKAEFFFPEIGQIMNDVKQIWRDDPLSLSQSKEDSNLQTPYAMLLNATTVLVDKFGHKENLRWCKYAMELIDGMLSGNDAEIQRSGIEKYVYNVFLILAKMTKRAECHGFILGAFMRIMPLWNAPGVLSSSLRLFTKGFATNLWNEEMATMIMQNVCGLVTSGTLDREDMVEVIFALTKMSLHSDMVKSVLLIPDNLAVLNQRLHASEKIAPFVATLLLYLNSAAPAMFLSEQDVINMLNLFYDEETPAIKLHLQVLQRYTMSESTPMIQLALCQQIYRYSTAAYVTALERPPYVHVRVALFLWTARSDPEFVGLNTPFFAERPTPAQRVRQSRARCVARHLQAGGG